MLSQFVNTSSKRKSQSILIDIPSVAALAASSANSGDPLMAVGRLDKDTEGLLLLTTSGSFSRAVTYGVGTERVRVEKEYYCQVDGVVSDAALESLRKGVEIGVGDKMYVTKPGIVRRVEDREAMERVGEAGGIKSIRDVRHGPTSWISMAIKEGRNRQVRKMTAAVGFPTLRLVRVRVGGMEFDGLDVGGVREIKEEEVFEGICMF